MAFLSFSASNSRKENATYRDLGTAMQRVIKPTSTVGTLT